MEKMIFRIKLLKVMLDNETGKFTDKNQAPCRSQFLKNALENKKESLLSDSFLSPTLITEDC